MRLLALSAWAALAAVLAVGGALLSSSTTEAASLQVQPLLYNEQLKAGEKKKGFIDISNPTNQTVKLETSVEAFRQIDDQGSLEFFAAEAVEAGITPDFKQLTLGPRQTMRMAFELDGSRLPTGDVFAALFFTTTSGGAGNLGQALRVGTLFVLENGTPPTRQAAVTGLEAPWFSFGSKIAGSYKVKNTAAEGEATGFMPTVSVKLAPFGETTRVNSSLVFAGRERVNQFSVPFSQLGLYKLSVAYADSSQSRWILLLPTWAIYTATGLGLVLAGWLIVRRQNKRLTLRK